MQNNIHLLIIIKYNQTILQYIFHKRASLNQP